VTSRRPSQCGVCARYRSFLTTGLDGPSCSAFPAGIPTAIFDNDLDHRQPVEGDHGLRWLSKDGAAFPDFAFVGPI